MALHFYVSTSLESLAGTFLEKIYKTGTGNDPLKPVIATVQTQGIATWLKQYIAKHSKIAMNLKMPFLRSAVEQTHSRPRYVEDFLLSLRKQGGAPGACFLSEK